MPESTDETIVIRWVVEAQDAIAKHKELQQAVVDIKAQLKELSSQTNATYKEMSKAMISSFSEGKIKELLTNNPVMTMTQAMKEAAPEIIKYKEAMARALAEIRVETATSNNVTTTASRNLQAQQQAEAQAIKIAQQQEAQAKRDATNEWLRNNQMQANAMKQLEADAKRVAQTMQQTGGGTGKGGGVGGMLGGLFGGGGGLSGAMGMLGQLAGITGLIVVLRKVIGFLMEAADSAMEFQQSVFAMVVGVRALQRAGVDITLKDMAENLTNLKEKFGVFSMVDLVKGSAAFLNLNRDMGFTKEQLFELQEAIATLAVVNGRSMDEVQKTVALALSSGYTEGLQRLGVSINRVTIAQEAANLGWKGGYTSLNEQQRALATYNLIIRKTAIYQEDLLKFQETLPGKMMVATKKIQDNTVALGENLTGLRLWWEQAKAFLLEQINLTVAEFGSTKYEEAWLKKKEETLGRALTAEEKYNERVAANREFYRQLRVADEKEVAFDLQAAIDNIGLTDVEAANKTADQILSDEVGQVIQDRLDEINQIQEDYQKEYEQNWEDYQQDLLDMENEYWSDMADLEREWERRIVEINLEYDRKKIELETDFNRDMEKIREDATQKAEDENIRYQNDVADEWASYYASVASAQAKYQNQQISAEIAFQEKLRKLREGLMFDLEDALRARDARQVLQLIRRYQLEKTQAEREYEQQKDEMRRQFEEQMAELARQRDERLASLWRELQARLAAILVEQQREEEARKLRYAQEKADEEANWQQQRDDNDTRYAQDATDRTNKWEADRIARQAEYKKQQDELWNSTQERYRILAEAMANELGLNGATMKTFYDQIFAVLGPGMGAESLYKYYAGMVAAYMSSIASLFSAPMIGPPIPGGQAEGGLAFANSPTKTTFGEAGPEMALFVPLNKKMSDFGNNVASNISGGSGGGEGRTRIEILLDPRLEGRIVDTTLENVADVIIRRLR